MLGCLALFGTALTLIAHAVAVAVPHPSRAPVVHRAPSIIPPAWKRLPGALPHDRNLTFDVHLRGHRFHELEGRMLRVAASGAEWLSFQELRKYTAVGQGVRQVMHDVLRRHGIASDAVSWNAAGDTVSVTTTIASASRLFAAEFSEWTFEETRHARTLKYTVPDEWAHHVISVGPIAHFSGRPQRSRPRSDDHASPRSVQGKTPPNPFAAGPVSCQSLASLPRYPEYLTPRCRADLYGTRGHKGKADDPVVGILAMDSGYLQSDLQKYLRQYRPEQAGYRVAHLISIAGGHNAHMSNGEAALDVETIAATVAPIPTAFVAVGNTSQDYFAAGFRGLIGHPQRPAVLSISYSGNEDTFTHEQAHSMCTYAQQLTALGTSIVHSTGDNGVDADRKDEETCPPFRPTYPSGCPYVTSVGGTFGIPETMVDMARNSYWSGAGFSQYFPTPQWQRGAVDGWLARAKVSRHLFNARGRAYPDVAAQGDWYPAEVLGRHFTYSGTSTSAAAFAAVIGVLNSVRRAVGKGSVGWLNPAMYAHPGAFHDVVVGGSFGCANDTLGFNATVGWDPVSGLGSTTLDKLRRVFKCT
ncbi:unnamed protein product [Parajaminaea phylloscopi]